MIFVSSTPYRTRATTSYQSIQSAMDYVRSKNSRPKRVNQTDVETLCSPYSNHCNMETIAIRSKTSTFIWTRRRPMMTSHLTGKSERENEEKSENKIPESFAIPDHSLHRDDLKGCITVKIVGVLVTSNLQETLHQHISYATTWWHTSQISSQETNSIINKCRLVHFKQSQREASFPTQRFISTSFPIQRFIST